MRRSAPAVATWGLVTGIAMAKSGLTIGQSIGMSLMVYAGSAQLAALPLIAGGFPLWTILVTAFIVNLRFVIFSAGIHSHFKDRRFWQRTVLGYLNGDLTFAMFLSRYPRAERKPEELHYFLGMSLTNWSMWQLGSVCGIVFAAFIPDSWGLGFAGVLALIAITVPMIQGRAAIFAALVAAFISVLAYGLPYKLNLLLAVIAAILVGLWLGRRTPKSEGVA